MNYGTVAQKLILDLGFSQTIKDCVFDRHDGISCHGLPIYLFYDFSSPLERSLPALPPLDL